MRVSAELIFQRVGGGSFSIASTALSQLTRFTQRAVSDAEAGGVMLGRHIVESLDVVVDQVSVPTKGDKRSRFGFFRSRAPHQAAIDKAWAESDGTCNYLGEWHTHPEPIPTPSITDLSDWRKRLGRDIVDSSSVFFVILGQKSIVAFEGNRKTLAVLPLEKVIL